ncbi:MAG: hypothetical protein VR73_05055 [Gammaproteobacteria bacterium BRH_c0]|nr:MAG: hypothetical protein VR73_05055 [Gammaproteobacteria bacterium BRH_c0]
MPASARPGDKTLAQLLPGNPAAQAADVAVSGICLDSRRCGRGDLFLAVKGRSQDGREHIGVAIAAGCAAVVAEADGFDAVCAGLVDGQRVPVIALSQLDQQLSAIAARFYGEPATRLHTTAITGTNGKTTCSYLLGQLFNLLGTRTGIIGTLGYGIIGADKAENGGSGFTATGMTTPDAVETQAILADFVDRGVQALTMEVSSHSLDQHRVAALSFVAAIFTNLSRDHLDYHGSLEAYGAAKARLFAWPDLGFAIINRDDDFGAQLLTELPSRIKGISYGLDAGADVRASDIVYSPEGINAQVTTLWGSGQLHSPLLGEFNLANLLAVIAAACAQGHNLAAVLAVLPQLKAVPGRMEQLAIAEAPQVVVDYAHTPDALAKALQALRQHCTGKLWCVFGCGGDRDTGKRPQMGAIAAQLADQVVVTSDNPRSEDPQAIIADILAGIADLQTVRVEADRRAAIRLAIAAANPGDTVLIAGKGHEDYQLIGGTSLPFSDVAEARLALRDRTQAGEGAL